MVTREFCCWNKLCGKILSFKNSKYIPFHVSSVQFLFYTAIYLLSYLPLAFHISSFPGGKSFGKFHFKVPYIFNLVSICTVTRDNWSGMLSIFIFFNSKKCPSNKQLKNKRMKHVKTKIIATDK